MIGSFSLFELGRWPTESLRNLLRCPNYKAAQWPVNAAARKSLDIFATQ
jgi:hypothetical protein